ncbi:MAG: hypothetical protein LLG01_06140 [Planctomycetaceae bacterium]|nr:hypothetical protein [Planctomycetaceae bacterium]
MRHPICRAILILGTAAMLGCAQNEDLLWYRNFYNQHCEEMAWNYREGHYEHVSLYDMETYFEDRVGRMTVTQLEDLMGPPRVVPPRRLQLQGTAGGAIWVEYPRRG